MNRQDLADGFRTQGRVLLALMLREARTRYGRRQAGYLWALVEPLMHIGGLTLIYSYTGRAVPLGDSLLLFLATGLSAFFGFRNVMRRTSGGYGSNEALLSFPIVKVLDVFLGRALLELVTWLAVSFILLGSLIMIGEGDLPRSTLVMLTAIAALFCIAFGVGTILGIVSEFVPSVSAFLRLPTRALYFLSGVFYLPDEMTPAMRDILDWNPVMHGITLYRVGYYNLYESHLLDTSYLGYWAVGSLLAALIVERAARKPLRSLT